MQRVESNEEDAVNRLYSPTVKCDLPHKKQASRGWYISSADGMYYLGKDGVTVGVRDFWPSENAARRFLTEWLCEQTRIGNKPHVMEALNTLQAYMRESGYGRATISANGGASFELEA